MENTSVEKSRMTVGILGKRQYPDRAGLYRGLNSLAAAKYVFRGEPGLDIDAMEYLARMQPLAELVIVLDGRIEEQTAELQRLIHSTGAKVLDIRSGEKESQLTREVFFVYLCDHIAVFDDGKGWAEWNDLFEYAKSQGKTFTTIPLYDFDENSIMEFDETELRDFLDRAEAADVPLMAIKRIVTMRLRQLREEAWPNLLAILERLR